MKDKIRKSIQIIILIAIILLGTCLVGYNNVKAAVLSGASKGEIFSEDIPSGNWDTIPANLFSQYGISLWCMQRGNGLTKHMTASEAYYYAYQAGGSSATFDGIDMEITSKTSESETDEGAEVRRITYNGTPNVYKYYRRNASLGLIEDHTKFYNEFLSQLKSVNISYDPYDEENDDQDYIDLIHDSSVGLPGIGTPVAQSIEYVAGKVLVTEENQDALFALTALPVYDGAVPLYPENLTEEQKEKGYFNIKEKQYALWEMGINIGNKIETDSDRNLGNIAKKYQEFYDAIHNAAKEDKYEDIIEVSNGYDDAGVADKEDIEETTEEIDGEEYKTYKYKNTIVETDTIEECYVLGPYCIDYTVDDEAIDVYYTTDGYEIKYNAIEKITVYNQDKIDITELGGSFKIAYSYNGAVTEENEGKLKRINDQYYYEFADGEEVSAFDSRKEFYIIVYRGDMEPEEFKGFYAKIDFQYLEHITGTLQEYIGNVYNYYYTEERGQDFSFSYTQNYKRWEFWYRHHDHSDDGNDCYDVYHWVYYDWTYSNKCNTYKYEMHREMSGETAQQMLAYHSDGERFYKKYSIVLTSEWDWEEPGIEIYKECSTDGEALYGAEFDITLEIEGTDIYKNEINETLYFTRTTNTKGIARIRTKDITQKGVYLGAFTGTITATFEETAAPASHAITQEVATMKITVEKGTITGISSKNETEITDKNRAKITIYDAESGIPKIQLAKVDENNNLIEEAYFEVHVAYTDPDGAKFNTDGTVRKYGELIDKKSNIIRGQTDGGVLNLTVEDFENMKYGFDITEYTGQITLDIVEISVDGAFSLSSDSREITLEYIKGVLVDYTEYTDKKVTVQYLYDSVKDNIYQYATGQIKYSELNSYVQDYLENWVKRQQKNSDLSYQDCLDWLVNYIEENDEDIMETVTRLTTDVLSDTNGDIVQVTIEDSIGDLPDIPDEPEPDPDPLFMTVAGTVFLDQTTTKESENEANGMLDLGEQLLYGIEVTLYTKDGNIAKLTQKDGEVRTNPTMTDENGYYEFRGVDPFEEYYVVFKYNGMEYNNTISSEQTYNSEGWTVSSKGSELSGDRSSLNSKYSEIGSKGAVGANGIIPYDYYALQGIYTEIAARVHSYRLNNGTYPSMDTIYAEVIANHSDDDEIAQKIEYIKAIAINAYAGYSSVDGGISSATSNGTYPYYYGERFVINETSLNSPDYELEFAGETMKMIYPGQLQVNLGLVERDSTDLSLVTDIVETNVSMNGYNTTYNMNEGLSSYHQYIYEEDYNYSKTENTNGVAYYTDDEVEFYMTYEATITNATLTNTALVEMVDYYNDKFSFNKEGYTTSKGNYIAGYKVTLNGEDITGDVTISDSSRYGLTSKNSDNTNYTNNSNDKYKELFVTFSKAHIITDGDVLKIQLTFKMDEASANLYNKIYTEKGTSDYSKLWEIGNYAEINGYMTEGGYLDSDSRPGNFVIEKFENAKTAYQEAYSNYVSNKTEDNARMLKLALGRLTDVREDDAWYVGLTLANNGYVREIHGSVWEAITDEVKTATNLQDYNGLLTYVQENGLEGLRVELVELCDDGTQIVRGKTTTGANGDYQFTSYIAGNYVVRFIYGEEDKDVRGKSTTSVGETLQVNGQYYQSTKANDATDNTMYWYDQDKDTRYSDAYDDARSRVEQINATIENTEAPSTSSDYEYDGVIEVESYTHKDVIYAYTSTLNLEVEYTKQEIEGNRENTFYPYKLTNIDFGLTPRATADLNIDKYVSRIMIYLQDGTTQLDVEFNADGEILAYNNENTYANTVISNYDSNAYQDGLIETLLDEQLLNGATLEITYTLTVSNDGEYDTIKYIYGQGKTEPVAIAYYGEDYTKLVSYEGDRGRSESSEIYKDSVRGNDLIVYHDGNADKYSLEAYKSGNDERIKITTSATNIIDYIDPNLNFTQVNKSGEEINRDWELTTLSDFNSYRESDTDLMSKYNTIIRASDNNNLYSKLLPGETAQTTLTLSKVLATSSTDTNDYEYSNLIEITKIHNDAGKIIDIEGYDVTGSIKPETSENTKLTELTTPIYPTLGTSKSETIVIHDPTGLNISEEAKSNLGIVLIVFVILAVGIVLIKKFVLVPKT